MTDKYAQDVHVRLRQYTAENVTAVLQYRLCIS